MVYTPGKGEPYQLWVPSDSKRALFTPQMEYWLQQWEELHGQIGAERFDLQVCKEAKKVDEATGVPGLTGARLAAARSSTRSDNSSFLAPAQGARRLGARGGGDRGAAAASPALKIASVDDALPRAATASGSSPARWCGCRRTPASSSSDATPSRRSA